MGDITCMYVLYEELIFMISVFKVHDTPLCFLPFFFFFFEDEKILLEEHIISIRV